MSRILLSGAFAALGLWVASYIVRGLGFDGTGSLVVAGLLLALANAFVRPIATILTLPITLLTLGLFLLVINAWMVSLVAWLLPGMTLSGFWAALFTAIVVSIVSWVGHAAIRPKVAGPTSR
jgi:putative membrane protein